MEITDALVTALDSTERGIGVPTPLVRVPPEHAILKANRTAEKAATDACVSNERAVLEQAAESNGGASFIVVVRKEQRVSYFCYGHKASGPCLVVNEPTAVDCRGGPGQIRIAAAGTEVASESASLNHEVAFRAGDQNATRIGGVIPGKQTSL